MEDAPLPLPRSWEVAGTPDQPPLLPPDSPLWDQMKPIPPGTPLPTFPKPKSHNQYCRDDWDMYHGDGPRGMGPKGDGCVCALDPTRPRLWDSEPEGVTHIAGTQMVMFGRYLRQRCEWCGIILLEYDLERVQVPVGQDPTPAMWTPMALVRVDGYMSAEIDNPEQVDGGIQLPPDSCAFNPLTQVGMQ